jgi:hypothetical protein
MDYKLTIKPKPNYVHFIVTGRNSRHVIMQYMKEVFHECKAHSYSRILIEERLKGPRLGFMDVFKLASEVSSSEANTLRIIAFVDEDADSNMMKFAETVAVNRSMPISVFATVAEAEQWLLQEEERTKAHE